MSKIVQKFGTDEWILPGNAACPGCSAVLALRHILKALGKDTYMVIPASCASVIQGVYPRTAAAVPSFNVPFASAASAASGIRHALNILGKKGTVLAFAGDGATYDIGLSAVSGAAERNEDIVYVCYDNSAYSNTGVQKSGATPIGAWTTTTPTGREGWPKDLPLIMAAHQVPYMATASVGYLNDLQRKVKKAKDIEGFRYIHVLAPCTTGWRFPPEKTIRVAKMSVLTGFWILFEAERGMIRLTGPSKRLKDPSKREPIDEFLKLQERFKGITPEQKKALQEWIDFQWTIMHWKMIEYLEKQP